MGNKKQPHTAFSIYWNFDEQINHEKIEFTVQWVNEYVVFTFSKYLICQCQTWHLSIWYISDPRPRGNKSFPSDISILKLEAIWNKIIAIYGNKTRNLSIVYLHHQFPSAFRHLDFRFLCYVVEEAAYKTSAGASFIKAEMWLANCFSFESRRPFWQKVTNCSSWKEIRSNAVN